MLRELAHHNPQHRQYAPVNLADKGPLFGRVFEISVLVGRPRLSGRMVDVFRVGLGFSRLPGGSIFERHVVESRLLGFNRRGR
jgi:hypothetical protein